ncbi:integrase [Vibrio breoganii]|uniref:tyrosine-type recombinase/integrase n=1 Tax=Vibrio breoganii TaxID=553239 RepID=UPI000C84549F|nr:tyrosine-type recombinase/integrase [Vibrio breoganii]PMO58748.1 integrase [Vibrio breoganii]
MAKRITDTVIRNLKIKDKEYVFTVEEGLQLRVRPKRSENGLGTKSWQFRYLHLVTRKITKISMGTYPNLGLAAAKLEVAEYRKQLALGIDPKLAKHEKKEQEQLTYENTFGTIAKEWFVRKRKSISNEHGERTWRSLEKYVLDGIGSVPIENIRRKDAIELLRPLEAEGKLSTIKRICQTLNQIMEFAVASDALSANPLTKMVNAFEKHQVKHMATVRPEMLGELLVRLQNNTSMQDKTKCLLLWQLHTMTRPREAARTRWEDIDLKTRSWTIPAQEMKRRKVHRVPLTPESIAILDQMRPLSEGNEFVFPSERNENTHVSVFTANAALKRSLGFKNQLVAHGLRSIASTALHEKGFPSLQVEACLAHSDRNETRASYNRTDYFEQRIAIMTWWSAYIESFI